MDSDHWHACTYVRTHYMEPDNFNQLLLGWKACTTHFAYALQTTQHLYITLNAQYTLFVTLNTYATNLLPVTDDNIQYTSFTTISTHFLNCTLLISQSCRAILSFIYIFLQRSSLMTVIFACNHRYMRYALAPCVGVSVGETQMSGAQLLRLAGTDTFLRSTIFWSTFVALVAKCFQWLPYSWAHANSTSQAMNA